MDRKLKAILAGTALLMGFYIAVQIARFVWILAFLMWPVLLGAAALYLLGYGAPNLGIYGRKIHLAAETKVRRVLDWLDFEAPPWTWPAILAARTFLDWLGLQVA